jgi:hypothetical protein
MASLVLAEHDNVSLKDATHKAVTAAAHKLARLIYIMLTRGEEYTDRGQQYFEERYRERVVRQLTKKARELGLEIVPATPAVLPA